MLQTPHQLQERLVEAQERLADAAEHQALETALKALPMKADISVEFTHRQDCPICNIMVEVKVEKPFKVRKTEIKR